MSVWGRSWTVCVLAVAVGCGPAGGGEGTEPAMNEEEAVGSTSRSLGAYTYIWSEDNQFPLSLDSSLAMFVTRSGSCTAEAVSVHVDTGSAWTMPFSGCRSINGGANDGEPFVQDSSANDILRWTVIAEGVLGWKKVSDTTGAPSGKLFLDSTHVFWSDSTGIRRAPRGGGSATTLVAATSAVLRAMRGTFLYYTVPVNGGVKLRRTDVNGNNGTAYGAVIPEIVELSVDSTHAYWADNSTITGRISRMVLSTGAVSDVTSGYERYYRVPRSTGSALYYVYLDGADSVMVRRNLSNGNSVPAEFPSFLVPSDLRVGTDYVYALGSTYAAGVYSGTLFRGDR